MKKALLSLTTLLFGIGELLAQNDSCRIYRQVFYQLSLEQYPDSVLNVKRITVTQFSNMSKQPGYNRSTYIIRTIQDHLEAYHKILDQKEYWRLNNFEDTFSMLDRLRKECPTINLKVYEDEIAFYQKKHKPYDPSKPRNNQ